MIRKNNNMLYTFNLANCTASGGCHWERSGPRHPLGGAPSVRSESSVRSRTAAGRCCRPERQPKTLHEKIGQFFHIRPNMDNNDTYLHLSKCFVVVCLFFIPGSRAAFFSCLCVWVSPCRVLSEVRILQTDFVRYAHKLYVLELSAQSCRGMCIDLEPVPMLKSGDKDCASQSGSGVGTLIAVM